MKRKYAPTILAAAFLIPFTTLFTGCSTMEKSPVPGISNKTKPDQPVPIGTVITALKSELADAFSEIETNRKTKIQSGNTNAGNIFAFKAGSGTLSGTTQVVVTDAGKIAAIIPFSGYAGTVLKPNIGGTASTTAIQAMTLSFSISPDVKNAMPSPEGIKIDHRVLKDALVAAYKGVTEIRQSDSGEPYDPKIQATGIELATSFKVVRKYEGGIASTVILPAPDIDSLAPDLSGSRERQGTYTLSLKLPFVVADTGEAEKRILLYERVVNGSRVTIQQPYTDERYKKLTETKEGPTEIVYTFGTDKNGQTVYIVEPYSETRLRELLKGGFSVKTQTSESPGIQKFTPLNDLNGLIFPKKGGGTPEPPPSSF